jgi:glycosyltransferase involved in cell wall biosynthesis
MRICLFSKPDAAQTQRLAAALVERGWSVHVVWHHAGRVPGATCAAFAIPAPGLRNLHRFRRRREKYLRAFLREFDLVSVQFLHSWGFTQEMLEEGRLQVRPWGSDILPPPDGIQPTAATLARRRRLLHEAHAVSVTCESFRQEVAEFAGLDPRRIDVLPLGVDVARFRPGERPATEPVVGLLKGFGHAYGPQHLVEAMPAVARAVPGVRFELVGEGPLKESCRRRVEDLGLSSITNWRPRVPHEEVPAVLARWQVSVIPSVRESFGIAALESSAMGLPVVASAVGGLVETIRDGTTGVLVPPADSAALAEAVIALLENPAGRRALGEAGRAFVVEHYDERTCFDRWHRYFLDVASGRTARGASALAAS